MPPVSQQSTDYLGFIYAALLLGGAFFAGIRRTSMISLFMGTASGLTALYGARLVSEDNSNIKVSMAVATILMISMGTRFMQTWKFMPSGLIMVLSLFMVCYYAILAAPFGNEIQGL